MIDWWRDHDHPNLLSADADTVLVRAAIDMNVVRDLTEAGRTNADESHALLAPHLVGLLEIVRTAALNTEIDRLDSNLRAQCTDRVQTFPSVRSDPAVRAHIIDELQRHTRPLDPANPRDTQDLLDLQHVGDAIAANLNVLVTNDQNLTRIYREVAERHGLRIMRPADVVIHIDELSHTEAYRPASLDTGYVERRLRSGENQTVEALRNHPSGERPRQLQGALSGYSLECKGRYGAVSANPSTEFDLRPAYRHGTCWQPTSVTLRDGCCWDQRSPGFLSCRVECMGLPEQMALRPLRGVDILPAWRS